MKNHNFWFLILLLVFLLAATLFWLAGKEPADQTLSTFREPTSQPFVTPPPGPPSAATGFIPPTEPPPGTPVSPFGNYRNPFQPPVSN